VEANKITEQEGNEFCETWGGQSSALDKVSPETSTSRQSHPIQFGERNQ